MCRRKLKLYEEFSKSGKLFCQNCGSKFRRQTWGKGKHKQYVWRCINREINGTEGCSTKPVKEKDLEEAFLRAMNKVIDGKETFIKTLLGNIYRGLENVEQEFSMEQIDVRLAELQQELMSLVRLNVKTGLDTKIYDNEYSMLAGEIEALREQKQKLKDAENERAMRMNRIREIEEYLDQQESLLDKFDENLFRRLIEKVKIQSLVEVVFVFRTGVEVREVLG